MSFDWRMTDARESSNRRATFADGGPLTSHVAFAGHNWDVFPITSGQPLTAVPLQGRESRRIFRDLVAVRDTFQVKPLIWQCRDDLPQTPHDAMQVALGDASVRSIQAGIRWQTFWAAVTPDAGDLLDSDW